MRPSVAITITIAALFAAVRGLPFILWPHSAFDADQAIVGLMAKHVAEGRAFPLFYYGQAYMLAVEAWMAAALFLLGGASIALLKLPLVALNAVAAGLLVWILIRDVSLRPFAALMASAWFVMCTPTIGAHFVAATGGSLAPFVYVLLLWVLRRRPMACGVVAGIGFLHREFSIYGLGALLIVDAYSSAGEWRRTLMKWLVILLAFLAVIQLVRVARPYNDIFGPDLPRLQLPAGAPTFYAITTRLGCAAPSEVAANIAWLVRENLPTLVGTTARSQNLYYAGAPTAAKPWLLDVLAISLLAALARTAAIQWRARRMPPPFTVFLLMIALQSCVFYVSSCDVRGPMLVRYTLLALLGPIAIAAAYLHAEPRNALRHVACALLLALATWYAYGYLRLTREYVTTPPYASQAVAADWLEARGIRHARADYWDGYYITFITDERVIVSSRPHRILVYESIVSRAANVMFVQRTPCGTANVLGRYWLCEDERVSRPPAPVSRFPSHREALDFREQLENKYRQGLRREPVPSRIAVGTVTTSVQEYLRYRLSGCTPEDAAIRVFAHLEGRGMTPACGALNAAALPRDELLHYRQRLDTQLAAWPAAQVQVTAVDGEGEVVWLQAYILGRLDGCAHGPAIRRVFRQIDGVAAGGC